MSVNLRIIVLHSGEISDLTYAVPGYGVVHP